MVMVGKCRGSAAPTGAPPSATANAAMKDNGTIPWIRRHRNGQDETPDYAVVQGGARAKTMCVIQLDSTNKIL